MSALRPYATHVPVATVVPMIRVAFTIRDLGRDSVIRRISEGQSIDIEIPLMSHTILMMPKLGVSATTTLAIADTIRLPEIISFKLYFLQKIPLRI